MRTNSLKETIYFDIQLADKRDKVYL